MAEKKQIPHFVRDDIASQCSAKCLDVKTQINEGFLAALGMTVVAHWSKESMTGVTGPPRLFAGRHLGA